MEVDCSFFLKDILFVVEVFKVEFIKVELNLVKLFIVLGFFEIVFICKGFLNSCLSLDKEIYDVFVVKF